MADRGSPVGVPVRGRLALVLAATAPVIVACGSGETPPPAARR